VATVVREEWQAACAAPDWVAQLLGEALHEKGDCPFEETGTVPFFMRESAEEKQCDDSAAFRQRLLGG
jgi:hypothetical protein